MRCCVELSQNIAMARSFWCWCYLLYNRKGEIEHKALKTEQACTIEVSTFTRMAQHVCSLPHFSVVKGSLEKKSMEEQQKEAKGGDVRRAESEEGTVTRLQTGEMGEVPHLTLNERLPGFHSAQQMAQIGAEHLSHLTCGPEAANHMPQAHCFAMHGAQGEHQNDFHSDMYAPEVLYCGRETCAACRPCTGAAQHETGNAVGGVRASTAALQAAQTPLGLLGERGEVVERVQV